ncbi:hypothetical protein MANES_16G013900v8 [Manihot esculenta]|uniref:Uncharacterized protein n=1 Tax=Manihot esculenta TaxID=3983 RepID=A0ACB7G6U3_MANES|nr:hypothetical protein MANES_16G013900v8 [Manihot esculenta]
MNPFKLSISLSLLLSLAITAKAQPKYIHHFCSNTTIFSTNSTYQANLYVLFTFLSSNASRPLGFHYTSAGQNPDDVYGSFLCRGDYSPDVCQDCVSFATQVDLARRCPVEEEAMIWYDQCFVRYSNSSFFSTMEQEPMIYNRNVNNVTDVGLLRYLLNTTMSVAAAEAASIPSEAKKFAVKEVDFEESQKLYYLVQCTPDLSGSDCNSCLQIAISLLLEYCDRSKGGRMWCPSCGVRYEMYIFFNTTVLGAPPLPPVDVLPPAPPPTTEIGTRPPGKRGISTVTIVAIVAAIFVSIVLSVLGFCLARKKCNGVEEDNGGEEISSLQFDLSTLTIATKNFSDDNKLGEGGFGQVYKGTLPDGQEIAVKRLSRSSVQGAREFKNEVLLLAKLQHRNLVKLRGFCLEVQEKILVYEFVPNKSLDDFLFDPEKRGQLDWRRRYKIIEGIAKGCLYLHEDSRPRVIHRDLKASNILLDKDMNPKISDFGMARIFGVDQTHADTSRIARTLGYMPPEYAMHGLFSVKSDT